MSAAVIRRRILYHGRVQGVGFRFTTASLARRYPVVGYVRNLPDGTVELVAESNAATIDQFVADIASEFSGYIRTQCDSDISRDERLSIFEVRR